MTDEEFMILLAEFMHEQWKEDPSSVYDWLENKIGDVSANAFMSKLISTVEDSE